MWRDDGGAGVVLGVIIGGGGIVIGPLVTAGERRHWSNIWHFSKEAFGQECSRSRDDGAIIVD